MSGDQPGIETDQAPAGGIDFNNMINRGINGPPPEAMQRPQDIVRPGTTPQEAVKIGTDATNTSVIANKTLELSYKDPNFDNKLLYASQHGADKFAKIKIDDLPQNLVIKTWLDKNGYFFWYDDGTKAPKDHHYLPNNAFTLEANKASIPLELERIHDNQQFARENFGGFANFDRSFVPSMDGTTNTTSYYWKIASASSTALDIQEHALRESVRSSDNPYFKIYLSDIDAAQAMKPLRDRSDQGLGYIPNNEYTRKKIDDALSLSQAAFTETRDELAKFNQFPALNVYLPLAPQRPFWDRTRYPDDYMGFWGGAFNQSYGRLQGLTSLRGLVISGVIPRVHEVPPANTPN